MIFMTIAVLILVLALLGATWLRNTEKLLEQVERRLDERVDLINQQLDRIERQREAIF